MLKNKKRNRYSDQRSCWYLYDHSKTVGIHTKVCTCTHATTHMRTQEHSAKTLLATKTYTLPKVVFRPSFRLRSLCAPTHAFFEEQVDLVWEGTRCDSRLDNFMKLLRFDYIYCRINNQLLLIRQKK